MNITNSAISLNVADVEASATFLEQQLAFEREMQQDGFVSLKRDGVGFNVIFLRTGLSTFKPASHAGDAGQGLLLVFVVDDIDAEWQRVSTSGVPVATPIETEPWGERYFQMIDPNGVLIQLVQWV
ncbi:MULTISPECIES: VOC family protein [Microbacterium]|uniref:Glyoxalase n=1 Tax=Microbacterium wangchenii TaxID=2541726 RepID=A0ABX5SQN9_9MICO|nr:MULTISPECIES: VOC family protein [Microbacterium]MCK6068211.1 VOC family protein [Microbacterium sp. EYE_512]QBR87501.1 glyoxalase [Microbacterium wangchenii]TXK15769.1 glyoxalase [Microbacterium wangchenii]